MNLTREMLKGMLGTLIYNRSLEYYNSGRIRSYTEESSPDGMSISAVVRGAFRYNVEIDIPENDDVILVRCSCPAYETFGRCKHAGAVLLEYIARRKTPAPKSLWHVPESAGEKKPLAVSNSPGANLLLSRYNSGSKPTHDASIRIMPSLSADHANALVHFSIGDERQYVIKDIMAFAEAMEHKQTLNYGQKLTLKHERQAFDADSQKLISFICAYAAQRRVFEREALYTAGATQAVKAIPLFGRTMEEFFTMYSGDSLSAKEGGEKWMLIDADPEIAVDASMTGAHMRISLSPKPRMIRGVEHTFALVDRRIHRLSAEYAEKMLPLIDVVSTSEILFSPKGAQEFCQTVLPRIEKFAPVPDQSALTPYLPSDLEVRFYIDLPEKTCLTARCVFQYGEAELSPLTPESKHPEIRRNAFRERAAVEALLAFFDPPAAGSEEYTIYDEHRMYDFLTSGMEKLSENGDIYISDRLKDINMKKMSRVTVGVSAGDSVLTLNIDTGEFPISELEDVLGAMRAKKKYYRLDDGRFLSLNDSNLDSLANLTDGLGLSTKELEKGEIEVPLSRALYLDSAIKNDQSMSFNRDGEFKKLVRDFKTVDDSDFQVPETLDGILRNYQKTGFRWLKTLDAYRFGGILADDMGLGKTLQVLAYLLSVKLERKEDSRLPRPSLIVCPASLVLNWGEEAAKWTPELSVCMLCQNAQERETEILRSHEYDLVITSYDLLRRDIDHHASTEYYACILDEAQYIKNHETKSFKAVKQIKALLHIALSGTPVENRLSELWSIFDFLMPGYLYKYPAFRQKLEMPIAKNGDEAAKKTLQTMVSPFILRRMKQDVLSELPPKTETVNLIQMEEEQRKLYLANVYDVKRRMESATDRDKLAILAMLTRLRQLCCDPALCVENYQGESCKLEECTRMLEELTESGHAVLVFSQFTSMLARIRERLDQIGIPSFTLQGDTPREERAELVKRFNAGEVPVFLISLKAGGTGLNLTAADTVIHYDPWWNIAAQNQATDRCYRIGQTRKVQVYRLITKDTIEENIVKLQNRKQLLAETVTEDADGGIMSMSKDELMKLVD